MKACFVSNSQDLELQKCGHQFVYKQAIPAFVTTVVQSAIARPHNLGLTHQFEGDENRNNKQSHVDEAETSGTPLCIDYQKIRKWTNFLQKHSEVRLFLIVCLSVFFSLSFSLIGHYIFLFYF
jgi:nitrate reductase NapE component